MTNTRKFIAEVTEYHIGKADLLNVTTYTDPENKPQVIIIARGKELENLKQVISKSLNCWDKAPASLKELADILCHGKILQDYHLLE